MRVPRKTKLSTQSTQLGSPVMANQNESSGSELIKVGLEVAKIAYSDAIQPLAKETGRALGTIGKTINVALAPLRGFVWGWEQIESYVTTAVEERLVRRGVLVENVVTPNPDVAVPAFEALRYSKLRENYANLLATAMNSASADVAHPSFVEILKQLSTDEAKILRVLADRKDRPVVTIIASADGTPHEFAVISRNESMLDYEADVAHPELVSCYLDNLCRLGLVEIPVFRVLANPEVYAPLESDGAMIDLMKQIAASGKTGSFKRGLIALTDFGTVFISACVVETSQEQPG
jgi:hypothetical protein